MKNIVVIVIWACSFIGCQPNIVLYQVPELIRVSPESQGVSSQCVMDYFDSLMCFPKTEIHSVMILRHGKVISEIYPDPYKQIYGHPLFSCSKTFVAAAIGIAIGEKRLKLDDKVLNFFPEISRDSVDSRMQRMTIEDLLTMRSGLMLDWQIRSDSIHWIRAYLSRPMASEPGQRFVYDSMNTYILSAVIQRITDKTLLEYIKEKLFDEMDILEAKWEISPENISTGGWGLYLKPESMAKFGHLLLCKGMWNGKQLIPSDWVDKMMCEHAKNPHGDNYCFQMWACSSKDCFRADGAYGQFIYVIPQKDMVISLTQCLYVDRKKEEQLIWDVLLPGVGEKEYVDGESYNLLQKKQNSYVLPLLEGDSRNPVFRYYEDKLLNLKHNVLGWNSFCLFSDSNKAVRLVITDSIGRVGEISLGYHEWKTSSIGILPLNPRIDTKNRFSLFDTPFHTGGCYAWIDDDLYIKIHFVDWVSSVLFHFLFLENEVRIIAKTNYSDEDIILLAN